MNPLPDFAFWLRTLGVPALQVTALLALAGLIATKLRSARNQRALWLAAFAATGLLVATSFFGADRELAAWFKPKPVPERVIRVRTNLPVDATSAVPLPVSAGEVTLSSVASELHASEAVASPQPVWWPAWLWLAGGAALLGRKLVWRVVFAWWWRSRQALAGPELGAHVAEVAHRLGVSGRVRVIASPALVCPIAFGVLRPTVGLPADFAAANGTREREAMLAHELAHLSARDPLWLGLADLVTVVLWWHPLVWWARRQLRAACETAADEASVLVEDGPAVLANCLVTLAAQLPRRRAFGLLGMAGFRSDLGRRVERLLELRSQGLRPTARGRLLLAAIAGATLATALALTATAWALPRSPNEPPTLLALAEQAVAQAGLPGTDPAGAALPAPASKPASAVPSPSADDPRQQWQQWRATLLLQLPDANVSDQQSQTLACIDALLRRLYATRQFTSVKVEPVEPNRIQVFLRMKDTNGWDAVKTLVERRGELEFRRVHPASDELVRQGQCPAGYEILTENAKPGEAARPYVVERAPVQGLTSRQVARAEAKLDPLDSKPRVLVTFTPEGGTVFRELTRDALGQEIAVVVDGELLMAPKAQSVIAGGACEISGNFSLAEAGLLAASLQTPLPAKLKLLQVTVVAPAKPVEPTNPVFIQVNADGRILFDGQEVVLDDVAAKLAEAKAGSPELVARLSAETDAPMKRLVEVLDKCREAGITRIFISTIDAPRPATNAPPTSSTSQPAKSAEAGQSARVATLVQDAKLLYELGKLAEARDKFEAARKLAPRDRHVDELMLRFMQDGVIPSKKIGPSEVPSDKVLPQSEAPNPTGNLATKGETGGSVGDSGPRGAGFVGGTGLADGFASGASQSSPNPSGVSTASTGTNTNQLFTRVFKVNPETLRQSLEAVAGNVPTNQSPVQLLRSFLAAAGLDFGGTNAFPAGADANDFQSQAGKAVFYNDRNGMLLVRATARDLQTVETALQMLNTSPPQVVIEAKFVEVTMDDNKAPGFDWYLGNTLMTTNASGNQPGGTVSSSAGTSSVAIRTGVFPGSASTSPTTSNGVGTITGIMTDPQFRSVVEALQRGGTNGVHDLRGDELDWPGRQATNAHNVRVTAALGASMTGVLTDPQYRAVLRALERRSGADVLSAPRVTTVSGRQAQIQVADMRTVVNGIDPTALIQLNVQPRTNAVPFLTSTIPVGPTLDVIPTVAADGYTIRLNVIASIAEFLGYDQPPADAKVTVWEGGKASEVAVPLPRFRVRQMTTQALLWDGQTLVLAGMPVEDSVTMKDKVPVLGDLPAVGNLFRSESKSTVKKNLLVFITATIIDPAGNRVHSADNQPYDPNRVPPQTTR